MFVEDKAGDKTESRQTASDHLGERRNTSERRHLVESSGKPQNLKIFAYVMRKCAWLRK